MTRLNNVQWIELALPNLCWSKHTKMRRNVKFRNHNSRGDQPMLGECIFLLIL